MKYKYTKTVEVSIEGELPLLGYDIKEAAQKLHSLSSTEAIRLSLSDSREKFWVDVGAEKWEVRVEDKIRRAE